MAFKISPRTHAMGPKKPPCFVKNTLLNNFLLPLFCVALPAIQTKERDHTRPYEKDDTVEFFVLQDKYPSMRRTSQSPELHKQNRSVYKYKQTFPLKAI